MQTDCIILGGGASGLCAAAALAKEGLRVVVVERLDRVGKKILSTGNGRCNLSNENMLPAFYAESAPFVSNVYSVTPPEETLGFFSSLGLMTTSEDGRLYPRSLMAASVLDVLRIGCEDEHVTLLTGKTAVRIAPSRRGGWSVQLEDGEGLFAPTLLCAMGGSAAPAMGTDGNGVRLLTQLGHSATPLYPALVQLRCDHPALRSLKGVRIRAAISLEVDHTCVGSEDGELLFADYGVSGVCVFQLSRFAAQACAQKRYVELCVNLLPDVDDPQAWLVRRIALRGNLPAQQLFTGVFQRLLAQALLKEAKIPLDTPCAAIGKAQKAALSQAIARFTLPVTGTHGFQQAQVTCGGIRTEEINPKTMESRLFDGLYLAGEILDVDGPCGGYNLHFAFASALTAAKAIRNRLNPL